MNIRLRRALEPVRDRYDYILIDCPPALDLLTLNALVAADSVLIPIQCEFFALEGISQLMDTIDGSAKASRTRLQIEGILLTMYDDRTNLTRQVADDLREFFSRRGLFDGHPTKHPAGGGAQLRKADSDVRSPLARRRELHQARQGDP